MIRWEMFINSISDGEVVDLRINNKYQITELDHILFQVSLSEDDIEKNGIPIIIIGDTSLELIFSHSENSEKIYTSIEPLNSHHSRYFYNFFGESQVSLYIGTQYAPIYSVTFDILARRENATLANIMLEYLTENLEDIVSICFSKSRKIASFDEDNIFNFSKLEIIKETVNYLTQHLPLFMIEHRHALEPKLILSKQGQPTGPDSIMWALYNLDQLSPANNEDANIFYNNRGYSFNELPKETLKENTDIYENKVIHAFLKQANVFLMMFKESLISPKDKIQSLETNEFIQFNHTMSKYADLALIKKAKKIENLISTLEKTRLLFNKKIPSTASIGIVPKVTPYVAKHNHYRKTFYLIEQYHHAPTPSFIGKELFSGLKNLSIVYETTVLILLHEIIQESYKVQLIEQNYRLHSEELPFGGVKIERPINEINNYFLFKNENYDIELFYEAKIFPLSAHSKKGDLVNTSNNIDSNKYGKHHFRPDFIMKVNSKSWKNPLVIILDAKYKDAKTIKEYDINELTRKYLLNIHQVNENMALGMSPVKMLFILFAHNSEETVVRTVAPQHCINGQFPVLPQSIAISVKPNEKNILIEHFIALKEMMDKKNKS
ncbi:nuclease domain-containing protein [Photorhabdus khanii]|uniref:DUF2357 domain-containing protein n=1 Tax=Photorhabdus khanii subsp. guanajuatensis TaxID=2100166 RepID=A0A4V2X7G4_9GAMM|nr:nuclease domain-containing protein [Photorhabdus khanii]TDB55815.1 hypothetical protein C5467_12905 [Photorhabdus khanii subsp. guanajuatensis]